MVGYDDVCNFSSHVANNCVELVNDKHEIVFWAHSCGFSC